MSENDPRPTTSAAIPAQVLWPEQWFFSRAPQPRPGSAVPVPRSGD